MLKRLVIPILVFVVLAFIKGISPAVVVMLAFLVCVSLNSIANSGSLTARSGQEIVEGRTGMAQILVYALTWGSVVLMIIAAVMLFNAYDWVVTVGFIAAMIGYFVSMSAFDSTPN